MRAPAPLREVAKKAASGVRAPRLWASYVLLPILLAGAIALLVLMNYSVRHLWGELIYAVAITTLLLWELGRLRPVAWIFRRLDVPGFSFKRAFLWASFALVALPIAIHEGRRGLILLLSGPASWVLARLTRRVLGVPRQTVALWMAALAGIAVLALSLSLKPRTANAEAPPTAAPAPSSEKLEDRQLALKVRPLLLFDGTEERFPLDIEAAIEAGGVKSCRVALFGDPCSDVEDPETIDVGADYLEFVDKKGQRADTPDSTYYYRVHRSATRIYVDYWWYFTLNPNPVAADIFCSPGLSWAGLTCHTHAGDWEGVTVVLRRRCTDSDTPCISADGGLWEPAAVRYAQHRHLVSYAWRPTLVRLWTGLRQNRTPLRPLVFVAADSHASYPTACPPKCKQFQKILGASLPESHHDGRTSWIWNGCEGCVRRLPLTDDGQPAEWNAVGGGWGKPANCVLGGAYCDGTGPPAAPHRQKRYEDPGIPGPWACLDANGKLADCGESVDPDDRVPGDD